jgi:uncharacterized protein YceK
MSHCPPHSINFALRHNKSVKQHDTIDFIRFISYNSINLFKEFTMKKLIILLTALIILSGCNSSSTGNSNIETDPNFTIQATSGAFLENNFTKKIIVFDIPIYAVEKVDDKKLFHAANIMAQYLDNDEDGNVDNQGVWAKMKENKAFMVMWKSESDLEFDFDEFGDMEGQDLGNDETNPSYYANNFTGEFDASYEEVLHIITHAGFSQVYPKELGEESGSELANAMDLARGGHFEEVPEQYPENAWYTYYDETADYSTMATEYLYWGLTSLLGIQKNREEEINEEWKPNSAEKLQQMDPKLYNLLTNPKFKLPTIAPDGTYKH